MVKCLRSLLLMMLALYAGLVVAQDKLIFATMDKFPPFSWSEGSKILGIDNDIMTEMCKRIKSECELRLVPWKRMILNVEEGKVDGGYSMFKNPHRETFSDFVMVPIHYSTYRVFYNEDNDFKLNSVRDLKGKTIEINLGFKLSEEFEQASKQKLFKRIESTNMVKSLYNLSRGNIDGVVGNEAEIQHLLTKHDYPNIKVKSYLIDKSRPAYLTLTKVKRPLITNSLKSEIEAALTAMQEDGTIDNIYQKYTKK